MTGNSMILKFLSSLLGLKPHHSWISQPILGNDTYCVTLLAMRLLNHPLFKHPALTLFLVFCLPAQALAAVLAECEQHLSEHTTVEITSILSATPPESAPDCHGATSKVIEIPDTIAEEITSADANGCLHCSGVCQNLKPFNLAETRQHTQFFDASAFSRIAPDTVTGVSGHPSRPPCPRIPS
jgi:hypothetical protein